MTIGLPKAFFYYRYGKLWHTFFEQIGCDVLVSEDTTQGTLSCGTNKSIDECCLALKLFMGHVDALTGRCDYVFVPRYVNLGKNMLMCDRFLGLGDIVRNTYPKTPLLSCTICKTQMLSEEIAFTGLGRVLGVSAARALSAYKLASRKQAAYDRRLCNHQSSIIKSPHDIKILLAGQPYLLYDAYVGEPILRLIKEQGATPIYSDRCNRKTCVKRSKEISDTLYWAMNKETASSVALHKDDVDGIILITAFPCGTDSLVNELVMRRTHNVPIIQLLLDGQQGEAGLQTRIESFMDIIKERKREHAR